MSYRSLCGLLFGLLLCVANLSFAQTDHVSIATGGVTGVYYPAGGALCQMMNAGANKHGARCYVESSSGSLDNLIKLRNGDVDLAIVQSDWLAHAFHGSEHFEEFGAHKNIRRVLTLYSEPFTVVARKDSNIRSFEDLKGKRINLGNEGSGQRATMEWLIDVMGWWKSDFAEVFAYRSEDQARELCNDTFDAMVFMAGTPNSSVKQATTSCDSVIVPVTSERIDRAVDASTMYSKTFIPAGVYRGNDVAVKTFGVRANLVASSKLDAGYVRVLVESVMDELNQFKRLHPALHQLGRKELLSGESNVPWHEGIKPYLD